MDGAGDRKDATTSFLASFSLNDSSIPGSHLSTSNFSFVDRTFGGRGPGDTSVMSLGSQGTGTQGLVVAPGDLHAAFYRALQKMGSQLQVFEVVDEWMLQLENVIGNAPNQNPKMMTLLKTEWETWDLIRSLYFPRLSEDEGFGETTGDRFTNLTLNNIGGGKIQVQDEFHLDDKTHLEAILKGSKDLQEMKLILGWLETNYSRRVGEPSVETKDIAWEHTLDALKKDAALGKKNAAQVDSIDPDVVSRTGKVLHPLDSAEEERIMRGVFSYLRRGNKDAALAFLVEAGHPLKAFALFGSTPASLVKLNPRTMEDDEEEYDSEEDCPLYAGLPTEKVGVREETENAARDGGEYPIDSGLAQKVPPEFRVTGNSMRDLWQSVAWEICEAKENLSKFDRAAYAALLPHTGVLLEVAQTWEDKLWARVKGSVETRLEEELRASHKDRGKWEALPGEFWAQGESLRQILKKVDGTGSLDTTERDSDFSAAFLALQKAVMVNDVEEFLNFMNDNIEEILTGRGTDGDEEMTDHFVRFFIHVLLFFAIVQLPYSEALTNIAAEAFIRVMVRVGEFESTPFYVQKLNGDDVQAAVVASQIDVLMTASGSETGGQLNSVEIRGFLSNAHESELPLLFLSCAVVDKYRDDALTNGGQFPVHSLEWLRACVDLADNAEDAIAALVALLRAVLSGARTFLLNGEVSKTADVIGLVTPQDVNDLVAAAPQTGETIVREFVCYKELLEAEKAYALWRKSVGNKPAAARGGGGGDAERRWGDAITHHAEVAVGAMVEVLKFPGGWLKDVYTAEGEEEDAHAVEAVKRVVLKKVVFIVLNLLTGPDALGGRSFSAIRDFTLILCENERGILPILSVEDIRTLVKSLEIATRQAEPNLLLLPK